MFLTGKMRREEGGRPDGRKGLKGPKGRKGRKGRKGSREEQGGQRDKERMY
jgi:hypothetical protein